MTASQPGSTVAVMSTIGLPEDVAAALAAAAARRMSADEFAAEALAKHFGTTPIQGDALKKFIGCVDSGDPDGAGASPRLCLSFAAVGSSTGSRDAAQAEELLEEGGFGTEGLRN